MQGIQGYIHLGVCQNKYDSSLFRPSNIFYPFIEIINLELLKNKGGKVFFQRGQLQQLLLVRWWNSSPEKYVKANAMRLFSQGEEEKEGEEEEEEEEDGWMVPHGYLSEDEICEEDEEVSVRFVFKIIIFNFITPKTTTNMVVSGMGPWYHHLTLV